MIMRWTLSLLAHLTTVVGMEVWGPSLLLDYLTLCICQESWMMSIWTLKHMWQTFVEHRVSNLHTFSECCSFNMYIRQFPSWLLYQGNAFLCCLTSKTICELHHIQNIAACLVSCSVFDDITPDLKEVYWFSIRKSICYKILLITHIWVRYNWLNC